MSQPKVEITELDGALGVQPSGQKYLVVLGAARSGPIATPAAFARTKDLVANFGGGRTVVAGARHITAARLPVVFVRTGNSTAGEVTDLDTDGVAGTSTITVEDSPDPADDAELYLEVVTGGTIGTAGIVVRWSENGGRTLSPPTALGTDTDFTFPGTGVTIEFAEGTLVADDVVTARAKQSSFDVTELGAALEALRISNLQWECVHIVGDIDGSAFDAIETVFADPRMSEKFWIGNFRIPDVDETEAEYKTAFDAVFAGRSTTKGAVCAGACEATNGVNSRSELRPISHAVASLVASVSEEIDVAQTDHALAGVTIRDENGNPKHHDETVNPGLDDSRALVLRTWEGNDPPGVFVNNPRLLSAAGSDFEFIQHRRVFNLAKRALRIYFTRRLSKPVVVNKTTGFILETEALEIEAGATQILRDELLAKPKASDVSVTISRTDNLLSTKTMTVQSRITPLAYPKAILIDQGFRNPALQVQTV